MVNLKANRKNNNGSTLLTVVTVSCFAAILIAAVLGFVARAHKNAYHNYNSEQAYYIATSALDSIHDYLEKDGADYTTLLDMAGANGGAGSNGVVKLGDLTMDDVVPGGECTVSVKYMGTAYIRVSVTGRCNGQEETINAYYSVISNSVPAQIDNAIYASNDITFALSATNAGSITSNGSYETSNNSKSNGSIVTDGDFLVKTSYTWTDDPNGCGSFVVVGGNFLNNNSGTTFYPGYSKVLTQNVSEFITVEGGFMPIQSMSIGTAVKVMDVYANTVYLGGAKTTSTHYKTGYPGPNSMSLTMFGNMYCYKYENASHPLHGHDDDGDFIVTNNATSLDLTGDLFVEGDIVNESNHNIRINGTLFIADDTTITTPTQYPIICNSISYSSNNAGKVLQMIQNKKIRIPKTPGGSDYYSASEFQTLMNSTNDDDKAKLSTIVRTDAIVHTASNHRNYKPSTDYNDYKREYENTSDFVNNNAVIKNLYQQALVTSTNNITNFTSGAGNDANVGLDFSYVVNKNYCYIGPAHFEQIRGKDVLIDMTKFTGDCVVVIDCNNQSRTLEDMNILIKNGVKKVDGTEITAPEGFCYIIVKYDDNASTTNTLNFKWCNIYDYCTYQHVVKGGKAINLTSYVGGEDEIINEIYNNVVYTPNLVRNYVMVDAGDKIAFPQDSNNYMMEAILYAPGVNVDDSGNGNNQHKYLFDAATPTTVSGFGTDGTKRVAFLGAMICNSFNSSSNTFAVAFSAPAPGSGVGSSGSSGRTEVRFSHYESR